MTTITPATNIFQISSDSSANWLASATVALQNQRDGGLISMLSGAAKNKPGSIGSFLASTRSNASDLMNITAFATTSATQLAIQQGDAVTQARQQAELDKALKDLQNTQNNVVAKNTLDPVIYFDDGSTIDTNANIYTRPDGSQYDTVTGAPYVDPASLVQLANGAYLNTKTNVMTLGDGTAIDMITGLNVNQLNPPGDGE